MINIWKKNKQYISAVIILCVFWLSIQFGVISVISLIQQKSNLIEEKTIDRENQEKRIQELPKLREQYAQLLEKEDSFRILVGKEEELSLIKMLEKIAEETGNVISIEIQDSAKIETGDKKKKDTGKDKVDENVIKPSNENYLAVAISLEGSYNNLADFIQKVENMKYWSDIISIDSAFAEIGRETRSSDIFSSNGDENIKNETIKKKIINTKLTVVFYRE